MHTKKRSIKFLLFRVTCCLISSVLVSMAMLGVMDTYSWFADSVYSGIQVSAITVKDIMPKAPEIKYHDDGTIEMIMEIQGVDSLGANPVLYFSVERGKEETRKKLINLPDYVLHINPLKIVSNGRYKIPIETDVNFPQGIQLLFHKFSGRKYVAGQIKIKYLNEYFDEVVDVEIPIAHLIDSFERKIERKEVFVENPEDSEEIGSQLTRIIMNIAGYRNWEEASWSKTEQELSKGEVKEKIQRIAKSNQKNEIVSDASTVQPMTTNTVTIEERELVYETMVNPISKLEITEDQKLLIDVIVPKLTVYIEELYNTLSAMVDLVNEKIKIIAELMQQIQTMEEEKVELMTANETLLKENEELKIKSEKQEESYNQLLEQYNDLGDNYSELQDKISELNREIEQLTNQLSSSSGGGGGGTAPEQPGDNQNPGGDNQNPGGDNQNPGGDNQNPGGDNQNPVGDSQNPVGDSQNPGGDNQNPGGDDQNPVGDSQNPVGDNQNPVGDDQNPVGDDQNPGGDDQNPVGDDQNPGGDDQDQLDTEKNETSDQSNKIARITGGHEPIEQPLEKSKPIDEDIIKKYRTETAAYKGKDQEELDKIIHA